MSQRSVERALGKLITDEGFRTRFFQDPEGAGLHAGLNLSGEEIAALRRIPKRALARLCAHIDDRICRLHVVGEPDLREQTP